MNIKKIGETVDFLDKRKYELSEEDRQFIVWYACKVEDGELTEKLAEELSVKECAKEAVTKKFLAILDREEPLIEQTERLLVSVELIRLKEKAALEQLEQILRVYGLELPEKVKKKKEEVQKETVSERKV